MVWLDYKVGSVYLTLVWLLRCFFTILPHELWWLCCIALHSQNQPQLPWLEYICLAFSSYYDGCHGWSVTRMRSEVFDFTKSHLMPLGAVFYVIPGATIDPTDLAGLTIGMSEIHILRLWNHPLISWNFRSHIFQKYPDDKRFPQTLKGLCKCYTMWNRYRYMQHLFCT